MERARTRKRWGTGDQIIVTAYAPEVVVEHAPDDTMISLELLASGGGIHGGIYVSGDRIHLGSDRDEVEVVYRITGWDAAAKALIVTRDRP